MRREKTFARVRRSDIHIEEKFNEEYEIITLMVALKLSKFV